MAFSPLFARDLRAIRDRSASGPRFGRSREDPLLDTTAIARLLAVFCLPRPEDRRFSGRAPSDPRSPSTRPSTAFSTLFRLHGLRNAFEDAGLAALDRFDLETVGRRQIAQLSHAQYSQAQCSRSPLLARYRASE
jgi:hypothetical protein